MKNQKNKLENEKQAEIIELKNEYQERIEWIEKIREEKNDKIEALLARMENYNIDLED